jgi:CRP-like cAMP-binding protein
VRQDPKVDRLASIPLFADAGRRQLERIASLCTEVSVGPGTVLTREGGPAHEFFVLEEGTVEVLVGEQRIAEFGPGDFFGELALLDGSGQRTATVTTLSDARLLVLTSAEFSGLLESEPTVAVRMLPAIGRRIRATRTAAPSSSPVL